MLDESYQRQTWRQAGCDDDHASGWNERVDFESPRFGIEPMFQFSSNRSSNSKFASIYEPKV